MTARAIVWMSLLLVGLTGCASVNLSGGFPEVSATVEERAGARIAWNQGMDLDARGRRALRVSAPADTDCRRRRADRAC